jgi:hypothetical protein
VVAAALVLREAEGETAATPRGGSSPRSGKTTRGLRNRTRRECAPTPKRRLLQPRGYPTAACAKNLPWFGRGNDGHANRGPELRGLQGSPSLADYHTLASKIAARSCSAECQV